MDVAKAFDSVGQRLPVQADRPQLPAYCWKPYHHTQTAERSKRPSVSHVHTPCHAGCSSPGPTRPPVPFSLYAHNIPTPSGHGQLAYYGTARHGTALVATSDSPSPLAGYVEDIYVDWRCINVIRG
jgi:hypothetical protein